jgi:hypothetical protein
MIGYYDYRLVALSVLIAVFASYTALDLAGRTAAASGRVRLTWLAGGASAMGVGIWSMHYIGMLLSRIPLIPTPTKPVDSISDRFCGGMPMPLSSTSKRTSLPRREIAA